MTTPGPLEVAIGALAFRPEVAAFAQLMEAKLRENDHKPGWQHDTPSDLLERLKEETEELRSLINSRCRLNSVPPVFIPEDAVKVGREAADVANFAMMVADICGALATIRAAARQDEKGTDNG